MKELFYYIVECITEYITGIENGAIKLWELEAYLTVSDNVATVLNLMCACIIAAVICGIIDIVREIRKCEDIEMSV